MRKILLSFTLIAATVLLSGTILASVSLPDADAMRASKPKEIVVVGSKVKEVIREAGLRAVFLESCNVSAYDDTGRTVSTVERAPANNGGVVKIGDISSDAKTVDVDCIFQDNNYKGSIEGVELKERGTTDIHIKPIRLELS